MSKHLAKVCMMRSSTTIRRRGLPGELLEISLKMQAPCLIDGQQVRPAVQQGALSMPAHLIRLQHEYAHFVQRSLIVDREMLTYGIEIDNGPITGQEQAAREAVALRHAESSK